MAEAGAGQGPLRDGYPGKTAGALGDALRERGHRAEVNAMVDQAVAELAPQTGTRAGCAAVGAAQASWYRRHRVGP
jgi:stage V sporulation protein SpoVS